MGSEPSDVETLPAAESELEAMLDESAPSAGLAAAVDSTQPPAKATEETLAEETAPATLNEVGKGGDELFQEPMAAAPIPSAAAIASLISAANNSSSSTPVVALVTAVAAVVAVVV